MTETTGATRTGGSFVLVGGLVALVAPVAGAISVAAAIAGVLLFGTRRDAVTLVGAMFVLFVAVPTRFSFVGFGPLTPGMLVGSLALLWWVRARWVGRASLDRGWQPIHLLVLLLVAAASVGYATMFTHPVSDEQMVNAHRSVGILLMFVGITLAVADGVPTRRRLEDLLEVLVLCGAVLAVCGLIEQATGQRLFTGKNLPLLTENPSQLTISPRDGFLRIGGTAKHPIEFAVVLATSIPLGIHLAAHGRPAFRPTARWSTGLMAIAIPFAISRSGLIGTAVGVLVLSLGWSWRRRANALVGVVSLGAIAALAVPALASTMTDLFVDLGDNTSIAARTRDYRVLDDVLAESPVFGRGLGEYNVVDYEVFDNQYLADLVDGGYLGLGVELLGFVVPIALAWQVSRRRRSDPAAAHLGRALAASLSVLMVTWAFFDGAGYRIATALLFTLTGLAAAAWRLELRDHREGPVPPGLPVRPPVAEDVVPLDLWGQIDAGDPVGETVPVQRWGPLVPVAVPASVVVPAHDEELVLEGFLTTLLADAEPDELEVVVVCNGCRDRTAELARRFPVRVLELEQASKHGALNAGDRAATRFPRFYVDADVRVTAGALREASRVLASGSALAAAPAVWFDLAGCSPAVRAYYRVWGTLPYCRGDLVGSGVYGVSGRGHLRLGPFPPIIADDLWFRDHFRPGERRSVANARFVQHPPRDLRSLVRVRTRQRLGNLELEARGERPASAAAAAKHDRRKALASFRSPAVAVAAPVYLAVNALAKRRARRRWRDRRLHWDSDVTGRLRSAT